MEKDPALHCGVLIAAVVLLAIVAAACGPGKANGNYVYYIANWSHPTNSSLAVYINGVLDVTYPAGSGTSNSSYTHPCNKYTGGGDWNGGGHLPGYESAPGTNLDPLAYDSPAPAWEDNHSFGSGSYSNAMTLSNATAIGTAFDCQLNGGSIIRDGLYIHRDFGGNFVTYGCIKITQANLDDLRIVFFTGWGGVTGNTYLHTADVF